jgi:hypothetical protein
MLAQKTHFITSLIYYRWPKFFEVFLIFFYFWNFKWLCLHISYICSIWKILHFYSSLSLNPSKSAFFHALTVSLLLKSHMLFIVSKQCACSRRVHIEGHMNRFEYCHRDNNSDNDSFGCFLSKNRIFCSITRC